MRQLFRMIAAVGAVLCLSVPGLVRGDASPPTAGYVFHPYSPASEEAPQSSEHEAATAAPQEELADGVYVFNPDYYESYAENAWRIVSGPLRYDSDDWTNVAIVAGVTGGLLLADRAIRDFWQDDLRGGATDDVANLLNHIGDSKTMLFTALGAYAVSELAGFKREKAAALMSIESLLLTSALTYGMKYVTGRERPSKTSDSYDFGGPGAAGTNSSFPSGHAGNAFAVASVLSEVYGGDDPWVPWVAYSAAGGVALSRINDNKHWASDVALGGALGYFIGKMVVRYNPFLEEQGLTLRPFAADGAQGLGLAVKF